MIATTKAVIEAAFNGDRTVSEQVKREVFGILEGRRRVPGFVDLKPQISGIMSRDEVAHLLHMSKSRVDFYTRNGHLKRAVMPGMSRASGILSDSVRDFIRASGNNRPSRSWDGVGKCRKLN